MGNLFSNQLFQKIGEINKKYAKPKVVMTPMVKWSLLMLRLYLIFLVGILFFKFFTMV